MIDVIVPTVLVTLLAIVVLISAVGLGALLEEGAWIRAAKGRGAARWAYGKWYRVEEIKDDGEWKAAQGGDSAG